MVDTPQKVQIEAELDASQTARGAEQTARAISQIVNQVRELDRLTNGLLGNGGSLRAQLAGLVQTIQAAQALPAQYAQMRSVVNQLRDGTAGTIYRNASMQGVDRAIRANDAAGQYLRIERAYNEVLANRAELYNRIRREMPGNADERARSVAYRAELRRAGEITPDGDRDRFNRRTLAEVRQFENDWTELQRRELETRTQQAARATERQLRDDMRRRQQHFQELRRLYQQDLGAIMAATDPDARRRLADERLAELGAYAGRRGMDFDRDRLGQLYDDAENRRFTRDLYRRPPAAPLSPDERARRAYEQRDAFMNYNGGANRIASRFGFVGDFAAVGAVMGTAMYAGRSTMQLQSSLRQLQAISQATNLEMGKLQRTIFDVGQSSRYTTQEIAQAATVMAQAGYSANQIDDALEGMARLATAAGAELEQTVMTVTSLLTIYDMEIGRTEQVTNMLAEALNGSKLSFDQLALGLQYAGNVAADGGLQFDELTAALGAMANAGIRSGSTLGTGLRALIQELENPSEKFLEWLQAAGLTADDVDIRTQSLAGAMRNLTAAGFDSGQAMATFEIRAANAFSALSRNLDTLDELQVSMATSSAATEGAEVQMDSLAAQINRLGNAVTQFTTVAGAPFMSFLQDIIGLSASAISGLAGMGPVVQVLVTLFATLIALQAARWLGGLLAGFLNLGGGVSALTTKMVLWGAVTGNARMMTLGLTRAMSGLTASMRAHPIGWLITGVTLLTTIFNNGAGAAAELNQQIEEFETAASTARSETERYSSRVDELNGYLDLMITRHGSLSSNVHMAAQAAEVAIARFGDWGLQIDQNITQIDTLINRLVDLRGEQAAVVLNQARSERSSVGATFDLQRQAFRDSEGGQSLSRLWEYRSSGFSGIRGQAEVQRLMTRLWNGTITNSEIVQMRQLLGGLRQTPDIQRLLEALDSTELTNMIQSRTRMTELDRQIANYSSQASEEAEIVGRHIADESVYWSSEQRRVAGLEDPEELAREQAELARRQREQFARTREFMTTAAGAFLDRNPGSRAELERQAAMMGVSVEDYIANGWGNANSGYAGLAFAGGRGEDIMDLNAIRSRIRSLRAQRQTAIRAHDMAQARALEEEIAELQRREAALSRDGDDPYAVEAQLDDVNDTWEANGETREIAEARRQARIRAATLAAQARAFQRQIEGTQGTVQTGGGTWARPVDSQYAINSGFQSASRPDHNGIDIAAPAGTEIRAAAGGTLRDATSALNGNAVTIRHADGSETTYLHMETVLAEAGYVEAGQVIGRVGSTGRSTGPHLHLQYRNASGQLEDPSGLFGQAGPGAVTDNREQLQSLLDQWKATRIEEIRQEALAQDIDDADLQARLAAFEVEAQEYFTQVLSGNLSAAKALLAESAARIADEFAASGASGLRLRGGDPESVIDQIQAGYDTAMQLAMDAADAEFRARGLDPAVEADAIKRRQEIQADFAGRVVDATLNVIEAYFDGEAQRLATEIQRQQSAIDRERSQIASLDNSWNRDNISDVQRYLAGLRGESLDTREAGLDVRSAQNNYTLAQRRRDMIQTQLDEEVDPSQRANLETELAAANVQLEAMALNLERAQMAFEEMTAQTPSFQSVSEALGGAWQVFTDQMNTSRSIFEDLADGLVGVFETAKGAFGTLVKDLMSGTKTMGEAFKDFTMSVLQSMLDLAAEILSREILLWVMQMIAGQFGGGKSAGFSFGGKGGFSYGGGKGMALGGEIPGIRKMALGGDPAPFRDNVLISAQPGEIMMSKSAVDMVGRDTLLGLNAMGNTRLSRMPSMQSAMPQREPDTVNVWVVAPDQKPQHIGKKDILAVIAEDVATGGQTKKLIKAVAVGGM